MNVKSILRKKKVWIPILVVVCVSIVAGILLIPRFQSSDKKQVLLTAPELPEITFRDFGIKDGTYTFHQQKLSAVGELTAGYANKTFLGIIRFSETAMSSIHFAGKNSGWEGVMLHTASDGVRFSDNLDKFESVLIDENGLGVQLIDNDVEMALSIEVVDTDEDGQKDDVRFWLSFDGNLYQNKPIVEARDYAQYLGTYLSIYVTKENASVTVASKELTRPAVEAKEEIVPPKEPTFEEITFGDFGIADRTYSYDSKDLAVEGNLASGYANKTFVGTINFSSGETTYIRFAGRNSGWEGVMLYTSKAGLVFEDNSGPTRQFTGVAITQADVEVPLKGRDIELKLSFEVTDIDEDGAADDVRFWIYFEGELYKQKPIVEAVDYAQYLGTYLGIYSNSSASRVDIKSKQLDRPMLAPQNTLQEPSFSQISFQNFGIADGEYVYKNDSFAALGQYEVGYQNKTFAGTVCFSSATPTYIRFAGKTSGWEGIALYSSPSGLVFVDPAEGGSRFQGTTITEAKAGVALFDNDLDLTLTFEVTDLDDDGAKDDVRFWLRFNGELYQNKPIAEALNYTQYLGNYLSICSTKADSFVSVQSK